LPTQEERAKALVSKLVSLGTINQADLDKADKAQKDKTERERKLSK